MSAAVEVEDAVGCPVCAGIEVVTYAVGADAPRPFCGRCGRRMAIRWVEPPPRRTPASAMEAVPCAS